MRVRARDGSICVHVPASATLGDVRTAIEQVQFGGASAAKRHEFMLRTTVPQPRAFVASEDDARTLVALGLAPSAVLVLQHVSDTHVLEQRSDGDEDEDAQHSGCVDRERSGPSPLSSLCGLRAALAWLTS